jgi:hypothetical protein
LTSLGRATVASALGRIEQELFEADWAAARAEHGDAATACHLTRTPSQRRHDALVEMARRAITAPASAVTTNVCAHHAGQVRPSRRPPP